MTECKSSLQIFKSAWNSFHALVNFDFWKKIHFFHIIVVEKLISDALAW